MRKSTMAGFLLCGAWALGVPLARAASDELSEQQQQQIITKFAAREAAFARARETYTYRQRYLMVAARAPVIDLVVLDPNNPRSVAYQINRVESHLAALERSHVDGRLSPTQQIALSLATTFRTIEAAAIDDALMIATESGLMRLSDAIASSYLTHNVRSESSGEALA